MLGLSNPCKLLELAEWGLCSSPLYVSSSSGSGNQAGFPDKWALFWEDAVAHCQCVI